ncbi:benzoate/H(+) symporter BenE family transporter [Asticcacaulis sp.]|uniref:benzoate/H(+) symporter BenE family transporter n=1 Tax=Asticcacaulis sp. TaxID=1872648 RepID=UPI00391C57A3
MAIRLPPLPSWSAAGIATFVGFGGTIPLVIQALTNVGATVEQAGSGVTVLCLGIALAGAALSFRYRIPVVLAWSTPGAALLAASTTHLSWAAATAVFAAAGIMVIVVGVTPLFGRLIARLPAAVASAMLAGVLLPFCLNLFRLSATHPVLIGGLLVVFLAARRKVPLYSLILVLGTAIAWTGLRGELHAPPPGAIFGTLLPEMPRADISTLISLSLPLFLVTLVSQNLPGLVVLRSAGYEPPAGPLIATTGLATLLAAPFGAHGVNLAAITASLCTSQDAHPDAGRRWLVAVIYAGLYLALALFAPALVRMFVSLPPAVIAAVTGLALIAPLISALETSLSTPDERNAAIVTFLATGSGVVFLGLGSAFWGLVAGGVALTVKRLLPRSAS